MKNLFWIHHPMYTRSKTWMRNNEYKFMRRQYIFHFFILHLLHRFLFLSIFCFVPLFAQFKEGIPLSRKKQLQRDTWWSILCTQCIYCTSHYKWIYFVVAVFVWRWVRLNISQIVNEWVNLIQQLYDLLTIAQSEFHSIFHIYFLLIGHAILKYPQNILILFYILYATYAANSLLPT